MSWAICDSSKLSTLFHFEGLSFTILTDEV